VTKHRAAIRSTSAVNDYAMETRSSHRSTETSEGAKHNKIALVNYFKPPVGCSRKNGSHVCDLAVRRI